jgi:hypothetical protein
MRWCVSRSEVLQGLRALRRLELRDAESPEDIERTLFVLDLFQDGMKAVLKSVRLEELIPRRCAEQKPACAIANELLEDSRQSRAGIHIPTGEDARNDGEALSLNHGD